MFSTLQESEYYLVYWNEIPFVFSLDLDDYSYIKMINFIRSSVSSFIFLLTGVTYELAPKTQETVKYSK